MNSFDVAIVGAGIVGAACAASISATGLSTVIIDSGSVAGCTTAAGMGHIVVMDDSEAQFELTHYSQRLWENLAPELPRECEFERCGTIWVAADDMELAEARRKQVNYEARGIKTEILDERQLRKAEPNLREGLAGGLLIESDSVVYQIGVTRYLIDKARKNGLRLRIGERVSSITDTGVSLGSGEHITALNVVNAAGTSAADLTPGLEIGSRKGHLLITDRYPGFAHHQLIELGYLRSAHGSHDDSVAFNLQPRSTGQVLLGSSRQFGAQDREIDHAILSRMTARAFEYMPNLRKLSTLRAWTGYRPATPDNLPYIGKWRDGENLLIAAGHEGLGITTSLGTAELITDAILRREPAIPAEPYSPSRAIKEH